MTSPLATAEPWNLVAPGYVAENLPAFEAFAHEALRRVPARGDVLDVAAGPGTLALQAAHTARRVVAVDFAPAMLAELRARRGALVNVEAHVADGQALPFADARFDAAYSMFGVIFYADRARGLGELARVLRPGGRVAIASWPPAAEVPAFAHLFEAMRAEVPGSTFGEGPTALGSPDDIRAELTGAGFGAIEVHRPSFTREVPGGAALWDSFTRGGAPAVLMRRKMGEAAFADLSARVGRRLERTLGAGPFSMRLEALIGTGTRR